MITRRQLLGATGLVGASLGLGACSDGSSEVRGTPSPVNLELDLVPEALSAAFASTRITWQVLTHNPDAMTGNVAISPSSLSLTLAILGEGASGRSAESLDDAMELFSDRRSIAFGALRESLNGYAALPSVFDPDETPSQPQLHMANRLVIVDDAEIRQEFLDRLSTFHDTGVTEVSMANAAKELGAWARENTGGFVEDTAINVTPDTRLITQDTLLFAAAWRKKFTDETALPFDTPDGRRASVPAMRGTLTTALLRGASEGGADQWSAIRLPYDDRLAMDVFLPAEGVHPSELLPALEITGGQWTDDPPRLVGVTLPTSTVTSSWELLEPLAQQGIDLTDMNGVFENATTGQMAQQVRLSVTAAGTEGAAATEAQLETLAPAKEPEDTFVVDRPYLMCVRDTLTGWPLFIAIINDPAGSPA